MLSREMAETIGHETMKTLGRNINIMDERGIILSSGDQKRIDTFHEAARKVIETGKKVVIESRNQNEWRGTRPGVNLPIKFQNEVIGVVGISGTPDEVEEFGALVVMMTELMVQQMYLMNQVEWKQRTREFLLEEILSEHPPYQDIQQKCRLLNIELNGPFKIIVFRLQENKRKSMMPDIDNRVFSDISCVYGFVDADTFVLLLSGISHRQNIENIQKEWSFRFSGIQKTGIGREVASLHDIYDSYQEVRTALSFSEEPIVHAEAYEAQLLLYKVTESERKVYKQRIFNSMTPDLRATMSAFFENDLNLSQTAKQLFIHRNTLIYRIDKIQEITGYDPRKFQDAVILQLAHWSDCYR
ncbi:MAG TPA: sugar diacid recognition domain-containing protein [Bacillales bacterium]